MHPQYRSVFIRTYGCQMNDLDSELVRSQLEAQGFISAANEDSADIVLINTCSVRALAEQKVWSQLGRLAIVKRNEKPDLIVGVIGCMAEREGKRITSRMPHVDVVCGPSNLNDLAGMLRRVLAREGRQVSMSGHTSRRSGTLEAAEEGLETLDRSRSFSPIEAKFQAFVRITRGCNKFCSFCVVPYVRGPEVHRAPQLIIAEVQRLVAAGAREVTLIGQTVNHYHYERDQQVTSFAQLLRRVHDEVPELPRLRFVTSYPRDFSDEALEVMAASPRICRYLHLPAQSGSNRLLTMMNRGYTVEQYEGLIERARERMPDVRFAGDMIVGFPSETDEDHRASVELLRRVGYKNAFIFKYSPRDGTVAARKWADDVPESTKRERNLELLAVQAEISRQANEARVGQVLSVLVEGQGKLKGDSGGAVDGDALGAANAELLNDDSPRDETSAKAMPPLAASSGMRQPPPRGQVRLVGRTTADEIVAFDGPASFIGKIVDVRATAATSLTILGELSF